jgi:hypothetical protein
MIDPTEADIGRSVLYLHTERGIITSFNSSYVFVRYNGDLHSKATRREDLSWTSPRPISPS